MLILQGTYHWFPRPVAFRRDYCRRCDAETTSVLIRTLDVIHVFWIPVLPIGRWSRWFCSTCGQRPHEAVETRRGFKIAAAVVLALMIVAVWIGVSPGDVDAPTLWTLRLGLPAVLALTIWAILRTPPGSSFKERLSEIRPHAGPECLLCGGVLEVGVQERCGTCGAKHRPLSRGGPRPGRDV